MEDPQIMHAHDAGVDGYRRSNRATGNLVIWTLAWIATLALARYGPALLWGQQQVAVSWVAVVDQPRSRRRLDHRPHALPPCRRRLASEDPARCHGGDPRRRLRRSVSPTSSRTPQASSQTSTSRYSRYCWEPSTSLHFWSAGSATDEEPAHRPSIRTRLDAGRPRHPRRRLSTNDQRNRDREVRPSLPLAFRLARLFNLPIEGIFIDEQ